MKLNLGSGTNRKQGFISVDRYTPEADEHWDLTEPLPVEDGSVEAIYASHVVEHFSRAEWDKVSKDWVRVLKPGGTIEIYCPNILAVCEKFVDDPLNEFTLMQIYGQQGDEGQFHKNGFTDVSLEASFPNLKAEVLAPSDITELHMRFTK